MHNAEKDTASPTSTQTCAHPVHIAFYVKYSDIPIKQGIIIEIMVLLYTSYKVVSTHFDCFT